ncbi:MAG: Flp family type IVb pilin [Deltaproteobacteria bacterium]
MRKITTFLGERGASSIEYAVISALIAGIIFLAVTSVGQRVVNLFSGVGNSFPK